jgi:trk system potassium uptake protein TrkA
MRVIVVGAGEVGFHVADRLSKERHDVVVVDVKPDRLEYVESHLDVAVIEGSGVSPTVLRKAGIADAGLLLAVTSVDEVNLVCCMAARGDARLVRVARVSNPDFYEERAPLRPELFGVDLLINPERELALETFRLLQSTAASDLIMLADGAVQLLRLRVEDGAPVAGRTLAALGAAEHGRQLLTVAVERDGTTIVPTGGTELRAGDHVYVMAAAVDIPRAVEMTGHERSEVRRVMLAGGSVEAYYLSRLLQQHGVNAIAIVEDKARAQELAEKLDQTLVLNGSVTDVELLELESVGAMDAFVALTEYDELNIIASLVARHAGAKQVITLVNKSHYLPLVRRVGLEVAVSPRLSAANAILRHVRRGGGVTRVATLRDNDAEVLSLSVTADSPVAGRPLSQSGFPEGAIVGAIVRGSAVMVPSGDAVLQPGDGAVVFALPEAVQRVLELFPA